MTVQATAARTSLTHPATEYMAADARIDVPIGLATAQILVAADNANLTLPQALKVLRDEAASILKQPKRDAADMRRFLRLSSDARLLQDLVLHCEDETKWLLQLSAGLREEHEDVTTQAVLSERDAEYAGRLSAAAAVLSTQAFVNTVSGCPSP